MVHALPPARGRRLAARGEPDRTFRQAPELYTLFARGGVHPEDHGPIATAVTQHSIRNELPRTHPHWPLTALLKDADGLDRVRLGDLDPTYLRHPEAREMVAYAEALFEETNGRIEPGSDHFPQLWAAATGLADRQTGR
jgi:hypothetical protein